MHRPPPLALRRPRATALGAALAGLLAAAPSEAEPIGLAPAGDHAFKLDAHFHDWSARRVLPVHPVRGACDAPDLAPTVQVAYGSGSVWVAAQVVDERFVAGATTGDRLTLRFVLPDGTRRSLAVVLNDLEPPNAARLGPDPDAGPKAAPPPKGAEVVATARIDGWAVEVRLPRAWLPGFTAGPVGFAAVFADADADATQVEAVCTGGSPIGADGWPTSPAFIAGDPRGFFADFQRETGRADDAVLHDQVVDLAGDDAAELIRITAHDVVVAGHNLPDNGPGYLYFSHGWPAGTALVKVELVDLDGQPGREILLERSGEIVPGETRARVVEVYGLHGGYLKRRFAHKLSEEVPAQLLEANAAFTLLGPGKGPRRFSVDPAEVKGFNPGNVVDVDGDHPPYHRFRWPWESKKPQLYALEGDTWVLQER